MRRVHNRRLHIAENLSRFLFIFSSRLFHGDYVVLRHSTYFMYDTRYVYVFFLFFFKRDACMSAGYVHPPVSLKPFCPRHALEKLSFALGVLGPPHWLDGSVGLALLALFLALLASPPSRGLSRAVSSLTEARTPRTSTWTWRGRPAGTYSAKSSRRRRYGIGHHDASIRFSHLYVCSMYVSLW